MLDITSAVIQLFDLLRIDVDADHLESDIDITQH